MKVLRRLILVSLSLLAACSAETKKDGGTYEASSVDSTGKSAKFHVDTGITIQDTFFINRTTTDKGQLLHAIYIDPNKNAHTHDWIFDLDSQDKINLKNYLDQLNNGKHKLTHVNLGNFPPEWRPVYQYHGKYYLYEPNDKSDKNTVKLTDSLLMIYYFGDGYAPVAIESFKRNTDKWVTIKTAHYPNIENVNAKQVDVYTIDKNTGLSVWVMDNEAELMVPRQGVNNYPVIVNSSKSKYPELDFDKIDPQKLISK